MRYVVLDVTEAIRNCVVGLFRREEAARVMAEHLADKGNPNAIVVDLKARALVPGLAKTGRKGAVVACGKCGRPVPAGQVNVRPGWIAECPPCSARMRVEVEPDPEEEGRQAG